MLEVRNLSVRYQSVVALKSVSLDVPEGGISAILGANGAGKSSLLKSVVGGVPRGTSGSIRFGGRELLGLGTEQIVRSGVALVPEGRQLFRDLTVEENLRMGAYLRSGSIAREMDLVHDLFPRLAERSRQHAATLSGGEQQMVAIGRALMSRPSLLMLDEPSLGLAPKLVTEMMRLIRRINQTGVTIVLVEQNARQALSIAQNAYVLEGGRIAVSGPARELASNPQVVSAYLGGSSQNGKECQL